MAREYGKIGKSLKNVVTPDEMTDEYGADTFRVYEMSTGPLDVSRPWETRRWSAPAFPAAGLATGDRRVDRGCPRHRRADWTRPTLRLLHSVIDGVRTDMDEPADQHGIAKLIELTNGATPLSAHARPGR